MNRHASANIRDTILRTRNPRSIFLYYLDDRFYLAATGIVEQLRVPNDPSILLKIVSSNSEWLEECDIVPCNPIVWPYLRDAAIALQPGIWSYDASFEDHLIQAVEGMLIDENYEKDAFPSCMDTFVTAGRRQQLSFEEHYRKSLLKSSTSKYPLWTCWGYLIRQGIPLYSARFVEDERIRSLKEPMVCMFNGCQELCTSHCAKCAWKYYCSREHQVADWPIHKRECCTYK
jgi:hypothetical protein